MGKASTEKLTAWGSGKVDIVITFSELSLSMGKDLCGVLGVVFMAYGFYSILHTYRSRPTIMRRKSLA
jgi:hypothetical protein